ncbi:hypothetical protein [Streptomyces sp. TLI_171]|uniref:hypothetical protein n=1 Tax=Streptomyces sp. TLI_171 TaxID=1938859 RepID=UPI000C19AE38|nr:hypothetical protein [Streptomyces sp. TLI_171]
MIVRKLHEAGLRSEHAYTAALASVGLSLASWVISMKAEQAGVERADRWGIFVGEWAPTFFGLGLALAQYESRSSSNAEGQLSSVFDRRTSEAG